MKRIITALVLVAAALTLAGCATSIESTPPTVDVSTYIKGCVSNRVEMGGLAIQTRHEMEYDCAIYLVHHGKHEAPGTAAAARRWLDHHPEAQDSNTEWQG